MISLNVFIFFISKGEMFIDILCNLEVMVVDMFVVCYSDLGVVYFIVEYVSFNVVVINGGDGCYVYFI